MSLKDEIDLLLRQNEALIQTLSLMGHRVESSLQMLSALASLTAIPMKAANLREASEKVLDILILELIDIESCSVLLFDRRRVLLKLLAARGQEDVLGIIAGPYNQDLTFRPGEGIAGRVFETNTPLFWDNNSAQAELIKTDGSLTIPESLACLPLSVSERPMGVLNISFAESQPFDPPRKRSLILLSNVVSNIMQTFLLREEVEEKTTSLMRARDELEQRVEARTAALVAATEGLKRKIAERKEAEKALKESEERYRSLVERTTDGFFVLEAPSGKFLYLNQKNCDLFGYSMEQMLSLTMWDVVDPEELEAIEQRLTIHTIEEKPRTEPFSFTAVRKDGSTFLAEISTARVTMEGKPIIHGAIKDVTHEVRLKQQFQQTQKMEAIGTLAGGIAHDFNNILSAMMGYTELVMAMLPEGGKGRYNLEQVLKAGFRARDLIKQILTFSRQTEAEKKPLLIGPIIKEALRLLRAFMPSTIEIRHNIETPQATILSDPTEIHQVLMNLGTNAGQAMRENGGVLQVDLEEIDFSEDDQNRPSDLIPGRYIRLAVIDSGKGMDEALITRIFNPYFTTKEKDEGTGLGLSVVHGIVKNHGGSITVTSSPGRGSTFRVYFPAIQPVPEDGQAEERVIPRGRERILFVDDEEPLADIGHQTLESLGYKVTTKTSSVEALGLFRANPRGFDLIITDQTMPHLTGAELSREILKIRPNIPIILCTGFSEQISAVQAEAIGIKRFIMKPMVASEVASDIRNVLDKKA